MANFIKLEDDNSVSFYSYAKSFIYDDTNMIVKNVDHYSSSQVKHNLHKIGVLK